jgi:phosphatidate cytidylyltransferase
MSPHAALHSEVFHAYLLIVGGMLLAGAVVLACLTWVVRRDVRDVWTNCRSWLLISLVVLACIAAGREATTIGVTAMSLAAFREFARATGILQDRWLTRSAYLGILCGGVCAWAPDLLGTRVDWHHRFLALPAFVAGLLLIVPVLRNRTSSQLRLVSLALCGYLCFGWMLQHVALLTSANQAYGYLLFLLLAISAGDIAAFLFGKLFGRRRLRSEVSPDKTWEGAIGAMAVAMVLPWALRFSLPHFGATQLILAGAVVGAGGQLGDLSVSWIKRDLGIRSMGNTIPGQGGIADRIDSLIIAAPLFVHLVRWAQGQS